VRARALVGVIAGLLLSSWSWADTIPRAHSAVARIAAQEALEAAGGIADEGQRANVLEWLTPSGADPEARLVGLRRVSRNSREPNEYYLIEGLAFSDPDTALRLLGDPKYGLDGRQDMEGLAQLARASLALKENGDAYLSASPDQLPYYARALARTDLAKALQALGRVADGKTRDDTLAAVVTDRIGRHTVQDSGLLLGAAQMVQDSTTRDVRLEQILVTSAPSDPEWALDNLHLIGDQSLRGSVLQAVASGFARKEPLRGLDIAQVIADPLFRSYALAEILYTVAQEDPSRASAMLEGPRFAATDRAWLTRRLLQGMALTDCTGAVEATRKLPPAERDQVLPYLALAVARAGRVEEAFRYALLLNGADPFEVLYPMSDHRLANVLCTIAQQDVGKACALVEGLEPEERNQASVALAYALAVPAPERGLAVARGLRDPYLRGAALAAVANAISGTLGVFAGD